jgi:hypothetical protein
VAECAMWNCTAMYPPEETPETEVADKSAA